MLNIEPGEYRRLQKTAKILRDLGDATRLCILERLMEQEQTVTSLVGYTQVAQGRLSSHLRILRDNRYVETNRRGNHVDYRLTPDDLGRAIRELVVLARELSGLL